MTSFTGGVPRPRCGNYRTKGDPCVELHNPRAVPLACDLAKVGGSEVGRRISEDDHIGGVADVCLEYQGHRLAKLELALQTHALIEGVHIAQLVDHASWAGSVGVRSRGKEGVLIQKHRGVRSQKIRIRGVAANA